MQRSCAAGLWRDRSVFPRWRRISAGEQALLALAHLRNGDTYTRLAAGSGIDVATAWRCVREAIDLLSAAGDDLATAVSRIRRLAFRHPGRNPDRQRWKKRCNQQLARIRARRERGNATLKTWKVLTKLRCCPCRATVIVQAILVLHHVEADRYAG
ncbi:transposase family protein [Actinoplanes sp. NPDC024001]|uniref:transposase family protein n=1 Tax=Actinoplanes sp. NPDC024001 TaxID=3154598 RepID=UPI0033E078EA